VCACGGGLRPPAPITEDGEEPLQVRPLRTPLLRQRRGFWEGCDTSVAPLSCSIEEPKYMGLRCGEPEFLTLLRWVWFYVSLVQEWDAKKAYILQKFATTGPIKVTASFDILSSNSKRHEKQSAEARIAELDDPLLGGRRDNQTLTMQEYALSHTRHTRLGSHPLYTFARGGVYPGWACRVHTPSRVTHPWGATY
jgi:hypothetical protein